MPSLRYACLLVQFLPLFWTQTLLSEVSPEW